VYAAFYAFLASSVAARQLFSTGNWSLAALCAMVATAAFFGWGYLRSRRKFTLPKGKAGITLLIYCSAEGHVDLARDLLEYGAHPDERGEDGFTPLMYAAANCKVDVYATLIRYGADPTLKSTRGKTALDMARDNGFGPAFEQIQLPADVINVQHFPEVSLADHEENLLRALLMQLRVALFALVPLAFLTLHCMIKPPDVLAFVVHDSELLVRGLATLLGITTVWFLVCVIRIASLLNKQWLLWLGITLVPFPFGFFLSYFMLRDASGIALRQSVLRQDVAGVPIGLSG
jgi:hypothetical protein